MVWQIIYSKYSWNNIFHPTYPLAIWPWSSPNKKKNLVVLPLKLDWPSELTYNQQNLVEVMLHDFWSWARKGQAVPALISWNTHLSVAPPQRAFSGTQLPCCDNPQSHGDTIYRHTGWQCLDEPSVEMILTWPLDMLMKESGWLQLLPCLVTFNPLEPSSCPVAEANHPQCALFRILTSGTRDYNKKFAILYH